MRRMTVATVAVLALTMGVPPAALAGKGGKGKVEKGSGVKKDSGVEKDDDNRHATDKDVHVTVYFGDRDRDVVRKYFVETHGRGHCPPGLAKKNNGCLPPGQAKKRYTVGRALPSSVVVKDLPRDISIRLGAAPRGYRYGVVDGDIVKLSVGTLLVVDAIDGFVD
jgi:hypothetical protein